MIIDIIAIIPLIVIAYLCGYYRGHVHALAVPYEMLAAKMEELVRPTQPDEGVKEDDIRTKTI